MLRENLIKRLKNGDFAYAITILIMLVLPIHYYYLPPLMAMLGLCWIIENYAGFKELLMTYSRYRSLFILFLIFYLWQIASILYSDDLKLGFSNVFGRLSLFVFPLILFNPAEKIRINVFRLLRIFALSTAAYVLTCFGYAFYRSLSFQDGAWFFNSHPPEMDWVNYFYGTDLAYSIHPSYLAMFVLISVFISFESWYDHSIKIHFRLGWLTLGVLLSVSIYFISSRAGILAGLLMILFYAGIKIITHKNSRLIWIIAIISLLSLLPLIRNNDRVNNFLKGFSEKDGIITLSEQDERIIIWKSAINLIAQNPLLGVGIGDVRSELTEEYIRAGEEKLGKEKLNAHNQFLEIFLEDGAIGIALFLFIMGFMIFIAIRERNLLFGLFILMMIVFFMFETVLYRLAGVAFFSLFSFILPHVKKNGTIISKPQKSL